MALQFDYSQDATQETPSTHLKAGAQQLNDLAVDQVTAGVDLGSDDLTKALSEFVADLAADRADISATLTQAASVVTEAWTSMAAMDEQWAKGCAQWSNHVPAAAQSAGWRWQSGAAAGGYLPPGVLAPQTTATPTTAKE
jgi:hypothetical protein